MTCIRCQYLLCAARNFLISVLFFAAAAEAMFGQAPPRPLPPVDETIVAPIDDAVVEPEEIPAGEALPIDPPAADELPWYSLRLWTGPVWENSFELGISGSEGNSRTLSLQFGTDWKRKVNWSELEISLNYNKARNESVETQHNAIFSANHNWLFADSPWSLYTNLFLEYDEFQAFDLRLRMNGGVGYDFLKAEGLLLKGRFGAGASREIGGPDNAWVPEANLGGDYEHQLTKRQKLTVKTDYYPAWTDWTDYRIVSRAGWEVLLDEASNLSFKLNIIDRYDSTPNGRKPNDLNYTFVLLWKL